MRHRFLVALYSDIPEEAEIADVLASLPQSRRQEFLRAVVKFGFNALHKNKACRKRESEPGKPFGSDKDNSDNQKGSKNVDDLSHKKKEDKKASKKPRDTNDSNDIKVNTEPLKDKGSNEEELNYSSDISETEIDTIDDAELDPIKQINKLFEGI